MNTAAWNADSHNATLRSKTTPLFSFRNILFPVDFSTQCEAAVPYVADLANRFQAKLTLLHVVRDTENTAEWRWRRSTELMALAAQTAGGMHWEQVVTHGSPVTAINHYVKTHGIDIVAMSPRVREGASRPVMDSVTAEVLRQVSCAVWTESSTGRPHSRWSPVLCALDLESGSEQVLSYASALADRFCANLIAVHVIPPARDSVFHFKAHARLEDLLQRLNISAEIVTPTGRVEDSVCAAADRLKAELLVIGRAAHSETGFSLVRQLVRSAPCPVVSCPRRVASTDCFWTEWQQDDSQLAFRSS